MSVQQFDENNYPIELPDDLTPGELEQVHTVAATPDQTGEHPLRAAAAIGGAFILYRAYLKARLKRKLRGADNLPPGEYAHAVAQTYADFTPAWTYMVTPAIFSSYMSGVLQSGQTIASQTLMDLAMRYSWNLGQYLNKKTVESAVRGYSAQLNRNLDARIALGNVVDAVGVTLPGMRSLVTIWTGKDAERPSEAVMPSVKKARARRIINSDINAHAKVLGEQEVFSNSQTGKQLAWTMAQKLGIIPENATRQWITARDERVCPQCGPLDGMEVGINEPFVVGKQKFWTPSLHVNCRCGVKLKAHIFREIAGRGISQAQRARRSWFDSDEVVDKSGQDRYDDRDPRTQFTKADEWDSREHPRDQRSGRFSSKPLAYKDPLDDIGAMMQAAQDREIQQAEVKPPELSFNASRSEKTDSDFSASGALSFDASRPGMKEKAKESSLSFDASPSLDASRDFNAARDFSAQRSFDATRAMGAPVSPKAAPPPKPKGRKRNYVSIPGTYQGAAWAVLQDRDFQFFQPGSDRTKQAYSVNNAHFTDDADKLELAVEEYRQDRVREFMDSAIGRSVVPGNITMPADMHDDNVHFLLSSQVLAEAVQWREQERVHEDAGEDFEDRTVKLAAYDLSAPGGVTNRYGYGYPVRDPGYIGQFQVRMSDIVDYYRVDELINNMSPVIVEARSFAEDSTEFDIDSATGNNELMVNDDYVVEYHSGTTMLGYKKLNKIIIKPLDDED